MHALVDQTLPTEITLILVQTRLRQIVEATSKRVFIVMHVDLKMKLAFVLILGTLLFIYLSSLFLLLILEV